MHLNLEVVSPQAASLGAQRRQRVGPKGLTIGRVPGNDWVIPDPYISKQHARITFTNGGFFVEGLGRNPIAIGNAENVIPSHQPHALKNGDHLFIDQYEVLVTLVPEERAETPRPASGDDPFGILSADPGPDGAASGPFGSSGVVPGRAAAPDRAVSDRAVSGSPFSAPAGAPTPAADSLSLIPDIWDSALPGTGGVAGDSTELDPLAALGGARTASSEPALPPVNWQQASPLVDHFEPPAPRSVAPQGVPENWDRSMSASAPPRTPSAIPDNWDRSVIRPAPREIPGREVSGREPAAKEPVRRPLPGMPPARPRPVASGAADISASATMPQFPPPSESAARAKESSRASEPVPASGAGVGARDFAATADIDLGARAADLSARLAALTGEPVPPAPTIAPDLADLLRGAGLSERDLSPEVVEELGKVLRVVVEGVMEVLRARSEIKSQFRLPLTRVQARENNPLKFSPNVESALHTLLVQRNPGYLPTVQAFEDAFADIRSHQMAMLEGLRTAYDAMLKKFDPQELEVEFERAVKRGGLLNFGGGKSKFWELYVERFSHLGRDADDTFRRLFGDTFAESYERQLERLKRIARQNALNPGGTGPSGKN